MIDLTREQQQVILEYSRKGCAGIRCSDCPLIKEAPHDYTNKYFRSPAPVCKIILHQYDELKILASAQTTNSDIIRAVQTVCGKYAQDNLSTEDITELLL